MVTWKHLLVKTSVFGCAENPSSRYVVLGIPLDQTTTYKPGTRFAPTHIRLAACNIEFYSLYSGVSLDDLGFNDLGDVLVYGDLPKALDNVEKVVRGIRDEYVTAFPIILGGEHTITYPVVKSLKSEIDELIVFDAHTDLRDEYLGSKLNHATVMKRIIEKLGIPVTFIGVRAYSREELEFIEMLDGDLVVCDVRKIVKNECSLGKYGRVYISVDIDVIDPAYAPGVSNPEPLGITPDQLIGHMYKVVENAEGIVGFDIVEVNPVEDVNDVTSILASKIVLELIGFLEKNTI